MKSKRKISMWLYIPQSNKVQFDPIRSTLTQIVVECTFNKVISGKYSSNVEYTYTHPRLNKKLTGIVSKAFWEA